MVMSPDAGGVFSVFSWLVRMGLGGAQGSGSQYVSWIHGDDFAHAIEFLITNESISGIVNITSPHPLPNHMFLRALRSAWGVPIGLPATAWMLEIGAIFLRTETELILKSRRVVPGVLQQNNFVFRFPTWEEAVVDLVNKSRVLEAKRPLMRRLWPFWVGVYFFIAIVLLYLLMR
jgi:NAD dependent epimerase/dehydratase family enzyme